MKRKINFSAGPGALPQEVLEEAARAVQEYEQTGVSILELSHRSKEFAAIVAESENLVKELCGLDDNYEVMWMHGGGRMQFCMIPMNFLGAKNGGYIDSGHWAEEAEEYATFYGDASKLASSQDSNYSRLPDWPSFSPGEFDYIHLTTNNTIFGTQWHNVPATDAPLIADMSSDIFCRHHDYAKYSMFYAAVQKNLGTPGVALVVIRKDLLKRRTRVLPPMLNYAAQAEEHSILNTANVSGVYISLLMLRWIKAKGMAAIEKENNEKARLVYDAIDNSRLFTPHVTEKSHRSIMNVCFTANTPEIEKSFLALCDENNIMGVKGHRSVGGFRVSLYNAVTLESVETLVKLMKEFEGK